MLPRQVRVAGRYVTVLLDPRSYDAVLKDTTSFTHNTSQLLKNIFSLVLPSIQPSAERELMEQ